jgi:catechol 2,3-dioxygenase-like lactoylglutathione lyase family enzyme
MALKRMDNVGIVVDDLTATIDFFRELGLELEGRATIEGEWAGRVTGLSDQHVEIAMMRTPDGHGRLELSRFLRPAVIADHLNAPVNALRRRTGSDTSAAPRGFSSDSRKNSVERRLKHVRQRLPGERTRARDGLDPHHADGKQIRAFVDEPDGQRLGRHVGGPVAPIPASFTFARPKSIMRRGCSEGYPTRRPDRRPFVTPGRCDHTWLM